MSSSKNDISFEQAGLGTILASHQLILPPNQREYAWEERHVTQLLQDYSGAVSEDGKGHFLGTIVTIPIDGGTLEVVDGQQRLATTSLLLAAIRNYVEGKDQLIFDALNNKYLTTIDLRKKQQVPNLRLNIDDNELFAAIVTHGATIPPATKPSHRRMMAAFNLATSHVKHIVAPHDPKIHGDVLGKWVIFIAERARAILVSVADGANAYRMFETLNDRGLRTSQADLIKSYLFECARTRIAEAQARWSEMRGALEGLGEKDHIVTFLRHALIIQRGQVRESAVYEEIQRMANNETKAIACASTLEVLAQAYVATFNPEHEKWNAYAPGVRRAIEVFNLLATKPLRPIILSVTAKFTKKELAAAFQFIVSLSTRLTISGGTTSGSIDEQAASVSVDVYIGKITTAGQLKKSLSDMTPTDERFKEAVAVAKVSQSKIARYYLRSLEMSQKKEPEPYYMPVNDQTIINLEHILPKKPMGNYPKFTDEEADLWLNRLGNQTLMRASDNSDSKSIKFEDKKALYAKSPYTLTSQLAAFSDWTKEAIQTRQQAMADLAVKTWPV